MRALAGVAVLAVVALTGCADSSAEPRVLPSLSVAPSPSAVPSPTPTGKDAPTPEGAAEFAKFVYAEIQRAFVERDPTIVEVLSTPSCTSCRRFVDSITSVRDNGEHVEGYVITVRTAVAPATDGKTARVDVIRDSTGGAFVDAAGKVIERQAPLRGIEEQMNLVRVGRTWKIVEIERIRVRG